MVARNLWTKSPRKRLVNLQALLQPPRPHPSLLLPLLLVMLPPQVRLYCPAVCGAQAVIYLRVFLLRVFCPHAPCFRGLRSRLLRAQVLLRYPPRPACVLTSVLYSSLPFMTVYESELHASHLLQTRWPKRSV